MAKSNFEFGSFVNADVMISAYDTLSANHEQAKELLVRLWNQRAGRLSVPVLQKFYLAVTQEVSCPMPKETAMSIIADFAIWKVYSPSVSDIIEAAGIQEQYHVDFEQAILLVSAEKMKCSVIWAEEFTFQKYKDILIKSIKEEINST